MYDLISRQAALDVINSELRCGAMTDQCGLETAYDLINDLPSTQPEPQWIPVSERLPEEYGVYLVTEKYFSRYDECEYNAITTAYYGEDGFENNYKILAWMPLPEPYEETSK